MDPVATVDRVLDLLAERGEAAYFSEPVTQTQHMLQSAELARREGAPAALVAAALLHDVGHLLHTHGEDVADRGIDAHHERVGAGWLEHQGFPPEVVEPIRLHVDAKRYRCRADPGYAASLSPASLQSLELQGGPMSESEAARFRVHPYSEDAIRLRGWDDGGKDVDVATLDLESFRGVLLAALTAPGSGR